MNTLQAQPRRFEFGFPYLDTCVLVEDFGQSVTIRATRNTFTEQRKIAFIRELAAEGFIDASYQWFSLAGSESYFGVRWRVDFSWLKLPVLLLARLRRMMVGMQIAGLVAWAVMLAILLHAAR
ncbi:MAG TPA: hypothetical protein VGM73_00150 [Candidatus Didemnitutus sp.]|jgi:hypothetical protein